MESFDKTIEYLTAYKHKLLELEEQHKQVKETHEQTEQKLLMEKTSHEETQLQLQKTKSTQESTQQKLEGKIYMWRTNQVGFSTYFITYAHTHCNHLLHYRKSICPACLNHYIENFMKFWTDQILCIRMS